MLFIPLWLFHAVAARCRFSLPAPSSPESCQVCLLLLPGTFFLKLALARSKLIRSLSTVQQVPCHSIVATPLLVAFELLLCVYLEGLNGEFTAYCDLSFGCLFAFCIDFFHLSSGLLIFRSWGSFHRFKACLPSTLGFGNHYTG